MRMQEIRHHSVAELGACRQRLIQLSQEINDLCRSDGVSHVRVIRSIDSCHDDVSRRLLTLRSRWIEFGAQKREKNIHENEKGDCGE